MSGHVRAGGAALEVLHLLLAKAEEQKAYWFNRQQAERFPDEGVSEDGESYTSIGDDAALSAGRCNGRYSEADWWLSTIRGMIKERTSTSAPDEGAACSCIAAMDAALAKGGYNGKVERLYCLGASITQSGALVRTVKADEKKRGKPTLVVANCCPFCGIRYPKAQS